MISEKKIEFQGNNINVNEPNKKNNQFINFRQKLKTITTSWKDSEWLEVFQNLSLCKKVHGVFLWDVNQRIRSLAKNNVTVDDFENGVIILPLDRKKEGHATSPEQILEIEQTIDQLEGLELLRLSFLEPCKPVYKEEKIFDDVSRWIEIHIYSYDVE
ncbi:hypothetical protein WAK64_02295 [Bacillus spongiae]|uniref:Uncharacterized protein n=1 Tax=Bacillus spongiae TaxID=2683610 RepID=A0ABU8H9L4_9BACI